MEVSTKTCASLEAKVIRADGTVEELGVIWNSNNNNKKLEEENDNGTSR